MSNTVYGRNQNNRSTNASTSRNIRQASLEDSFQSNQNAQTEQKYEHRGAYAVITPNENKRQKTLNIANKEAKDFEDFQKRNVPRYNICSTVGGESIPHSSSRLVNSRVNPTSHRLAQQCGISVEKQRSYQNSLKEKENAQFALKKQSARQQAERNAESLSARKNRLDEDRKIKNDAFLRRLEEEGKQKKNNK